MTLCPWDAHWLEPGAIAAGADQAVGGAPGPRTWKGARLRRVAGRIAALLKRTLCTGRAAASRLLQVAMDEARMVAAILPGWRRPAI
jgi:hypothetical protein